MSGEKERTRERERERGGQYPWWKHYGQILSHNYLELNLLSRRWLPTAAAPPKVYGEVGLSLSFTQLFLSIPLWVGYFDTTFSKLSWTLRICCFSRQMIPFTSKREGDCLGDREWISGRQCGFYVQICATKRGRQWAEVWSLGAKTDTDAGWKEEGRSATLIAIQRERKLEDGWMMTAAAEKKRRRQTFLFYSFPPCFPRRIIIPFILANALSLIFWCCSTLQRYTDTAWHCLITARTTG